MTAEGNGLYLMLISVHGLIRGHNLELGRDADTGGQTKYVVELARALARHPEVARVDLLTRAVVDPKVDPDYAVPEEPLEPKAHIIRLPCGPRRYLRKEVLWPHLDSFADHALQHLRRIGRVPDVIHSHYADAGYVGARLAGLLGVPLVHTGHSLGREKRRRLEDQGVRPETIERQYNITQRIEAEEFALDNAAVVVASTSQEVEGQYAIYDNYDPKAMVVIPPGIDLDRFYPPRRGRFRPPVFEELSRFLKEPRKPMILALSRADPRKNIATLVRAYGEHPGLREIANLVLIAGNRDDIEALDKGARTVLKELLLLIDRYDLYGRTAYPKHHQSQDVPLLYRLAAKSRGVFVNPALTEPFGLTLIEAAASGLPVVATEDGGPKDILRYCKNGVLIDPLDADELGRALYEALSDSRRWTRWSRAGLAGVARHFSWQGHVATYLRAIRKVIKKSQRKRLTTPAKSKLPVSDRFLICDVDNTLIGEEEALRALLARLREHDAEFGFGIATGRRLDSALKALKEWHVPPPDIIITSVGTEIHYGARLIPDVGYQRHIDYRWEPERVRAAMQGIPGLRLQGAEEQRTYKISYFIDTKKAPSVADISRHLRQQGLHVNVVCSHRMFLDLLPVRASKGGAVRYLAMKWALPVDRILVVGDAGNDEEMLSGNTLGVVVANHSPELDRLRGHERIYFAEKPYAWGILEGLDHYDFFGALRAPEEQSEDA
ncbi:MAG TPA: HAD-IIB family hydrolase [Gammaproteobacteria bacterium]|nr:HAD-IIB family hydrolase [Gammaproteobacteria bacterium]